MIANILQIGGAITISAGIGILFPPAGIIALGVSAIIFGISLERQ